MIPILKNVSLSIGISKFLFQGNTGTTFDSITADDLRNFKIPLPPLEIQEQIVKECQKVDSEVSKAQETIEKSKQNIILIMTSSLVQGKFYATSGKKADFSDFILHSNHPDIKKYSDPELFKSFKLVCPA